MSEILWLKPKETGSRQPESSFPTSHPPRETLVGPPDEGGGNWQLVVAKDIGSGKDLFYAETRDWRTPFRLGPRRLALANLPEDEERFPVATWVKRVLQDGVESAEERTGTLTLEP